MRFFTHLILFILAYFFSGLIQASEIPSTSDIRHELALVKNQQKPLIILFHLPHCKFCKIIENNYLKPLNHKDKILLKSIDLSNTETFIDHLGRKTTQAEWSKGMGVKIAPTVIALGSQGQLIAEPLIGSTLPDFYNSYLTQLLNEAQRNLK